MARKQCKQERKKREEAQNIRRTKEQGRARERRV